MDLSVDNTSVIPYKLCTYCRRISDRFCHDVFWDDELYTPLELIKNRQIPNRQVTAAIAEPLLHHDSLRNLQRSAESCHLCLLFDSRIGYVEKRSTSYRSTKKDLAVQRELQLCRQLYVHVSRDTPLLNRADCRPLLLWLAPTDFPWLTMNDWISELKIYRHGRGMEYSDCKDLTPSPVNGSPESRYMWSTTTDHKAGYEMISAWLNRCISQHESCRQSLNNIRPIRLLDLKASLSDQDICLAHAEDFGKQQYATLSYSWGNKTCVRLTTRNIDQFRCRIVLKSLPQTIQDAVKVCRALSIQYLWVDALCIIQEESTDFAHEIAHMGSIYAGSIVTVSAMDSTDCESGCFRRRINPLKKENCVVGGIGQDFTISVPRLTCSQGSHVRRLESGRLNQRGWVYQERMVSPRTIHFVRGEIIWECREQACCYRCAQDDRSYHLRPSINQGITKTVFLRLKELSLSSTSSANLQSIWDSIVAEYSTTILTNPDDRLNALAGIAQIIYGQLPYQASYGLWRETLLDGLLWYIERRRKSVPQRCIDAARCVPSWSWATTQASTRIRNMLSHNCTNTDNFLYAARITRYPNVTKFAPITQLSNNHSGNDSVRVRAWLRASQVVPASPGWGIWWLVPTTEEPRPEVKIYMKAAWEDYEIHQKNRRRFRKENISGPNLKFYHDDEPENGKDLFCVLLKRGLRHSEPYSYSECDRPDLYFHVHDCGIVCEAVDLSRNLFRRVGAFKETFTWNKWKGPEYLYNDRKKGRLEVFDDTDVGGWYSKSGVLRHLGFQRGRDGILEQRSSLTVDAQTGVRLLGLTLDDIQHQDCGSEETEEEQMLHVSNGQLSLFKGGYEEVEIEIM